MLTQTTTTTNNNNPKCTDGDALRDDWDARIFNAQRRAFKRKHAAAMDEPNIAKRRQARRPVGAALRPTPLLVQRRARALRHLAGAARHRVPRRRARPRQAPAHPAYAAALAARHPHKEFKSFSKMLQSFSRCSKVSVNSLSLDFVPLCSFPF